MSMLDALIRTIPATIMRWAGAALLVLMFLVLVLLLCGYKISAGQTIVGIGRAVPDDKTVVTRGDLQQALKPYIQEGSSVSIENMSGKGFAISMALDPSGRGGDARVSAPNPENPDMNWKLIRR